MEFSTGVTDRGHSLREEAHPGPAGVGAEAAVMPAGVGGG